MRINDSMGRTLMIRCAGRRMLGLLCMLSGLAAFAPPALAQAALVISQVYGGGGNRGATLKNDFVELFNRGDAPVRLDGLSLQYAPASGTRWSGRVDLPARVLQPGQYFLIGLASGTGGTQSLPAPDASGEGPMVLIQEVVQEEFLKSSIQV